MFLIVMGGLGFPVWHDIASNVRKNREREKASAEMAVHQAVAPEQDRDHHDGRSDPFRNPVFLYH